MDKRVVGIDLGTTHTVVAWAALAPGAEPEIFELPQLVGVGEVGARPLLPSFLYAPLEGEIPRDPFDDAPWVIGEYARRRGQELAGRTIASAKSWLGHAAVDRTAAILPWGSDDPAMPRLSPVDASARILAHVRRAYDEAFPACPLAEQQVVLTVPASFDQAARALTLDAAHRAGLRVRLLEEPQAAFYDAIRHHGVEKLAEVVGDAGSVLVADVGGGTTDLTLIVIREGDFERVAVGRHLLLGGDNMDLALAHLLEPRLVKAPGHLDPRRFGQLVLACRAAKERLLSANPPDRVPIALLGQGSALVGQTLRTELEQGEVARIVLDGFFPPATRDDTPKRGRTGLVAFGLPYEHDAAITRHIAQFVARHTTAETSPRAILLNGGVFRAEQLAARLVDVVSGFGQNCQRLPERDPDLAVARGAVAYGLALAGFGARIGGGAAHGYYLGIEGAGAICVVPRGAREGERHLAAVRGLGLRVGQPVRFELFSTDHGKVHAPGEMVEIEDEHFQRLPPVAVTFESDTDAGREVHVGLEGELTPVGTLELSAVESEPSDPRAPRRFALAFELRAARRQSEAPKSSVRPASPRFDEARTAIERVFGKALSEDRVGEVKDLWRELTRVLGEREKWTGELTRALFDVLSPHSKSRRRSPDHERVFWMLAGYCLRPGYGHPLDPGRIKLLSPFFEQGMSFSQEARSWQQFWIAWRRVAGGLAEPLQVRIRNQIDPFLAPPGHGPKKPKGFKPQALDEMLELGAALERVPPERRSELGEWLIERTWTSQDARLWGAIGRLGSREPAYASVHHVVPTRVAERWLDHLLREKWNEIATAPRAAMQLARLTGDRARDVAPSLRDQVAQRLRDAGADAEWVRAVSEHVPVEDRERAEFFGEELPVGLRLLG